MAVRGGRKRAGLRRQCGGTGTGFSQQTYRAGRSAATQMQRLAASLERELLGRGDRRRVGTRGLGDVESRARVTRARRLAASWSESDSDAAASGESGARVTRALLPAASCEQESDAATGGESGERVPRTLRVGARVTRMRRLAATRERERLGRGDWQQVGSVSDSDVVTGERLGYGDWRRVWSENDSDAAVGGESGARVARALLPATSWERE